MNRYGFLKTAILATLSGVFGLYTPVFATDPNAFSLPESGLSLLTGDSWKQGDKTVRIYGVQACIRGTYYTDHSGNERDCGEVSLAFLAALIHDTHPVCSPIAQLSFGAGSQSTLLVVCTSTIGGRQLDLGTMMISQGFAFAATSSEGKVVYDPYFLLEDVARQARVGLWAFSDVPHPNRILATSRQE